MPAADALIIRHLGQVDYETAWHDMQNFTQLRDANTPDELWFLEHPPVFTLGRNGSQEHLHSSGKIPVLQVDRGGQVTYHGPGQIVAYPLLDIRRKKMGVREMVNRIEESIIHVLEAYGVKGERRQGAPGIYVNDEKIAALGLRVRRGRTFHGLAFNVDMDLEPFQRINPCGFEGLRVTQLSAFTPVELSTVESRLLDSIALHLGYSELSNE